MSWDYHIALDAWASIRALDAELQEALLDELEHLCEIGEADLRHGEASVLVFASVRGEPHPLTLDLFINLERHLINVLDVTGV